MYDKGGKVPKHEGRPFDQLDVFEVQRLATLTQSLKRPAVVFTSEQIDAIGMVIEIFAAGERKTLWSLAVLPTHVHLVFARSGGTSEEFVDQLKIAVEAQLWSKENVTNRL